MGRTRGGSGAKNGRDSNPSKAESSGLNVLLLPGSELLFCAGYFFCFSVDFSAGAWSGACAGNKDCDRLR